MLVMTMLFPAIMLIFGKVFLKSAPKEINYAYGYRTSMSMKSKETWSFAHKFIGKLWLMIGIALLPINLIPLILCIGKGESVIGNIGMILCFIDLIALVVPIIPTEIALRKSFDKDGNKKANG